MNELQFSFKPSSDESEVVAQISKKSKQDRGRLIYLNHERLNEDSKEEYKYDIFYDFTKHKRLTQENFDELLEAVENNEQPSDRRLRQLYHDFKNQLKKSSEIRLKDVELEVCPFIGSNSRENKSRECILVNGQNGSGKSYWVGSYVKKWQKYYPKSPIYLLSNKPIEDEPAFDGIKNIQQIPLNHKSLIEIIGKDEFVDKKKINKMIEEMNEDDRIDNEEGYAPYQYFKSKTGQSLVICDDFESDGQIEKLVRTIINSILRVGRASRIYCILVTHTLCAGPKTKTFFTECDAFCLFNKGISPYHLKYCLKNYTKMNEQQITKVLDSESRWCFIRKTVPCYVIEEHKLWLY